jgi:hypothetical protein
VHADQRGTVTGYAGPILCTDKWKDTDLAAGIGFRTVMRWVHGPMLLTPLHPSSPSQLAWAWSVVLLTLAACSSPTTADTRPAAPVRPDPGTATAPRPAPATDPLQATATVPASDQSAAAPVLTPLETMASVPTKIFIRGKDGCEEWELSSSWGDSLEQLRVERVVEARRTTRRRIQYVFDYSKGHVIDSAGVVRYKDVWDAESQAWKPGRLGGETNACFSVHKPTLEEDGSISFGPHRWYRTEESCAVANAPIVVASTGCR